jgi:hypothetical protein
MSTGAAAFCAYAITSCGDLLSERMTWAQLTLDFPMTFEYICDELPFFDSWALWGLIGFCKRCRDNLVACFRQLFLNLGQLPFNIWMTCSDSTSTSPHYIYTGFSPSWLTNLFQQRITELGQAFTNPLPNPSNICDDYMSALHGHIASFGCISCIKIHTLKGETFCKELENRLALAISEVGNLFVIVGQISGI